MQKICVVVVRKKFMWKALIIAKAMFIYLTGNCLIFRLYLKQCVYHRYFRDYAFMKHWLGDSVWDMILTKIWFLLCHLLEKRNLRNKYFYSISKSVWI